MWIMVSGPYTAGAPTAEARAANLEAMNRASLEVLARGHLPLVGVNVALPLIRVAGEARFDELMMPISLAVAARCDACLRIGGPSRGADDEVALFRAAGKPVYFSLDEIPVVG